MKPRNRFEKAVTASNMKLSTVSPKAIEWALGNIIAHIAFHTSGHNYTCGDCGAKFDHRGKGKSVCCPHCGHRLQVKDTLKRKKVQSAYFSSLEVVDGLQVQRVFLLRAVCRKGMKLETSCMEVCRLWLNAGGRMAVTSRARTLGWYVDSFNWCTGIDLKLLSEVHWVISDTYVYPRYKVLPELRRNGMKGRLPDDCHPARLMKALLTDSRIEMMMKSRYLQAVDYFVSRPLDLDTYWQSYKVAARRHYRPSDYGLWCDTVRLLEQCGKDIHNAKYICPKDLKTAHDHWLDKRNKAEEKRRTQDQIAKTKAKEADFYKEKPRYFGIVISDNDIEISVLDSIVSIQQTPYCENG